MDAQRYNTVAIALHWAIALLILGQIAGGFYMHNLPNTAPAKFDLFQLHKSFGLSILLLTFLRLGWRLFHKTPALPGAMPGWQKLAARATHWLFYFLMLATPLMGLAIVSVSPKDIPTEWFGLVSVPHLGFLDPGADPAATEHLFIELHEVLSYAILGLLALHVAAALKHGFIDRDGVLRSMAPGVGAATGVGGVFIALAIGVSIYFAGKPEPVRSDSTPDIETATPSEASSQRPPPDDLVEPDETVLPQDAAPAQEPATEVADDVNPPPAQAANAPCDGPALAVNWRVDESASRLRFGGVQGGESFEGTFGAFTAEIAFHEAFLDQSWLLVTVQTGSAATGDQLIDSTLPGGDWFDVKDFPTATFVACDIRRAGGGYLAAGSLTIKDFAHDVTLPFDLTINDGVGTAVGGVDLIRTDFDLGADSSWLEDEAVAVEARVEFTVSAQGMD